MNTSKHDTIHHFANEFAFENLKDKSGVEQAHPVRAHRTRDGQLTQMQKQIADLTKRVKQLEQMLEKQG